MTIELNGTGGLMEGDFGTNDINVNLDSAYVFDGVDDFVEINNSNLFNNLSSLTFEAVVYINDLGDSTIGELINTRIISDGWIELGTFNEVTSVSRYGSGACGSNSVVGNSVRYCIEEEEE